MILKFGSQTVCPIVVKLNADLQTKSNIVPTTSSQIIGPDSGYDGLSSVQINAISPTKSAQTYTPTTSDQTIPSGRWLSGNQTIKGDANLVASNIKKDVSIFGVTGSYEGGGGGLSCYKITIPTVGDMTTSGTFQVTIKPIVTYMVSPYQTNFYLPLLQGESSTFKIEMDEEDCYVSVRDSTEWVNSIGDSVVADFYVSEYSIHDVTGMTQAEAESLVTVTPVTLT